MIGTCEVTQWIKAFAANPEDLRTNPWDQQGGRKEPTPTNGLQTSTCIPCKLACTRVCLCMCNVSIFKKKIT